MSAVDEGGAVGQPEIEMRDVTFPDGSTGVLAVEPGLSQDEADLIAARVWAELPEPGTSEG